MGEIDEEDEKEKSQAAAEIRQVPNRYESFLNKTNVDRHTIHSNKYVQFNNTARILHYCLLVTGAH